MASLRRSSGSGVRVISPRVHHQVADAREIGRALCKRRAYLAGERCAAARKQVEQQAKFKLRQSGRGEQLVEPRSQVATQDHRDAAQDGFLHPHFRQALGYPVRGFFDLSDLG